MTWSPKSLSGRLIIWFVVIQSGLSVVALAVTLFLSRQPEDQYAFAQMHVSRLVSESLRATPDGRLALEPTPALRAFEAARPEVRIAVMRGRDVAAGSSPVLANALRQAGLPQFLNATLRFSEGPMAGSVATASLVEAPGGPVVVVTSDNSLRLADLPALALHMGRYLIYLMLIVLAGGALLTPFVIRRALAPLAAASEAAAGIDLRSRGRRLPASDGLPSELAPLVKSINAALERLDDGVGRQQRYAAQAAHELRTPLAVLAARIDSQADGEQQQAMRRDLERMRMLVDQLLFVARLERRDVLLNESLDLVAVARDVVADYTPLALEQGRKLALFPEAHSLPTVGSVRLLESAVGNLVQNALRAGPEGAAVKVIVRAPGEVMVVDHGPGVAPADREQIFEPFWRKHEGRQGAGLGLTIVREAALAHGGSITVEETPGGGATFRLRLAAGGLKASLPLT